MAIIQVPPDSTGKRVDTVTLTDATVEVHRQKMVVTGGSGTAEVVVVTNAAPAAGDMGLVTRLAGTASVVLAAGAANIGTINNISATVTVSGGVAISGTATVVGVVGLTAGTANIGLLDSISRTVQVAVGTPFTINNISATSTVIISTIRTPSEVPSVSRGPRCVTASTSANVSFVGAPGAGLAIYVTQLAASNAGAVGSRARVGSSATPGNVTMFMASAGGGFVMQFEPPWQLSANEALLCSVKPNTSDGLFNVHFFVASADAF